MLSAGVIGGVEPKLWILSAVMGAAGLASSIIGGSASSIAARRAAARQGEQEANEAAWYKRRYNENYVDTAAGADLVRRAKEHAHSIVKRAEGQQAVSGGTNASVAAAKEQANKMVGDTVANIAATDQARKTQVDNMHRQAEQNFAQMDMQREMQRGQAISDAAGQASNAIMSVAGAMQQAGASKTNLNGGSNNSTPVIDTSVHESNLGVHPADVQPFSHTNDDLLKRMAGQVRGKLGV